MHTKESFKALVDTIQALGFDEKTAARYASLIGDTPDVDNNGLIVVIDERGRELARLALDFFNEPDPLAELYKSIAALGFPTDKARRYTDLIGSDPIVDKNGKMVVLNELGRVIDRIALDSFDGKRLWRNPNDPEFWFLYKCILRHGIPDRTAARWSSLVLSRGGPQIGEDQCFPVLDERGRELGRLPAEILTKRVFDTPEIIHWETETEPRLKDKPWRAVMMAALKFLEDHGFSRDRAVDIACKIPRPPEKSPDGQFILRDETGNEITRLNVPAASAVE